MTSPSYQRYVDPPTLYVVQPWNGSDVPAVQAFLDAHSIAATATSSGSTLYLLMGSSSPSYASGKSVVLQNDGQGWYVNPTRTSSDGLAPYEDYYAST